MTLLLECLDDYVAEENRVKVVDIFVNELYPGALGFAGVDPTPSGRPESAENLYLLLPELDSFSGLEPCRPMQHRLDAANWAIGCGSRTSRYLKSTDIITVVRDVTMPHNVFIHRNALIGKIL